jgi:hypothetical protein
MERVFKLLTIGVVIVCGLIVCSYVCNTNDRLYFSITAFDLPNRNSFTVGENSDICFKDVPKDYMTVTYDNDRYFYKIDNENICLYYIINNGNPNRHPINENSEITVFGQKYRGSDFINLLKNCDNEYYMLKDVLKNRIPANTLAAIENGEQYFETFIYKQQTRFKLPLINKTLHYGKPSYSLIILDRTTKIDDVGYRYSGILGQDTAELKIQFFKMNSWSVKKNDNNYFSDSVRSYFAKAVQMFTEWGAGHIKVTCDRNKFSVTFPKAITTAISTEKIRETVEKAQAGVYLKQMLKSYPMPTDFYIPDFSNTFSEYVCELSRNEKKHLIFQKTDSRDTIRLTTSGSFVPDIPVKKQELARGGITYKARILNKWFYMSKHWMLAILLPVLLLVLYLLFPEEGNGVTCEKIQNIRWYLCGMFTWFWFFLNQKLLIAEKLSFTYPYFEKLYPVSYLTTLFSLFAVFLVILLINKSFLFNYVHGFSYTFKRRKFGDTLVKHAIWLNLVLALLTVGICGFVTYSIFKSCIMPIWNSYFPGDISIFHPFGDAMNDNHFTVIWVVGAMLVGLSFLLIATELYKIKLAKQVDEKINKIKSEITKLSNEKINEIKSKNKHVLAVLSIALYILYIALYIALSAGISFLGNFGTAFAVLVLLFSLSIFLKKQIEKSNNKSFRWLIGSLLISCCFVFIGIPADFGFFINLFGVLFCWTILMWASTKHYNWSNRRRRMQFIKLLVSGIVVCVLAIYGAKSLSNPENIKYGRSIRRIENCIDPVKVKNAGYIYTESDIQWMEVMRYYAEKVGKGRDDNHDIYSEKNSFHQLVSSGQSPVILNDVCVPGVYLGSLRRCGWFGLLFGVMALGAFVYCFSIGDTWRQKPYNFEINRRLIGRLLAGNLWIGVTLYLLASYYWATPFTGRLIPGFGVDAVGEALEIIVLFAFMCALYNPFKTRQN